LSASVSQTLLAISRALSHPPLAFVQTPLQFYIGASAGALEAASFLAFSLT